jgi:hypothetical protein
LRFRATGLFPASNKQFACQQAVSHKAAPDVVKS